MKNKTLTFLEKIEKLDNTMVKSNANMMRLPPNTLQKDLDKQLNANLRNIYNCIIDVLLYFKENSKDLSLYSDEYKKLIDSWDNFVGTPASPAELGVKLQIVKVNVETLIKTIESGISIEDYFK